MIDDMDLGCVGMVALVVVVLLFMSYLAAAAVIGVRADRACMERGWPNSNVTYNLTAYCIKRVNQTDTVITLAKLRGGK